MAIRNLNESPAFGYETPGVNADETYGKAARKNPKDKTGRIGANILKMIGYIPFFSIAVGALRLHLIKIGTTIPINKNKQITRAVFEILGIGSLLCLPDIAITIGREVKARKLANF